MRKNKKKGIGKWEKGKGHKPERGYGVDDTEEWSVECGIIGIGATTKKWIVEVNRIHTLYRFYELSWEWESKHLLFVSPFEQQR